MNQFALALFGLTALFLATGHNPTGRKWAPIIGLMGQPAWLWFAIEAQARGLDSRGLLALVAAYTAVYIRGIWLQWGRR